MKSPKETAPATSASFTACAIRLVFSRDCAMSDFLHFRTAQNAGRLEDQHEGQERESRHVLVGNREIGRPQRFDEADQQPAEDGAGQRADTAENGGGKRLDPRNEAVVEG